MPVTVIDNLEDPRLDPYRDLRTAKEARRSDTFIAEGTTLVERVLQSEFEVIEVLATTEKLRNFQQRIPADTDVLQLDREQASKLVGYSFHTGVMCLARRKPSPPLARVIPNTGPALVLYADQVIDQQNLGLIIRIATGYGASAVVLGKGCADPFSRRVLRVSMGHGLFLPVLEGCLETPAELKSAGFEFCATVLSTDAVPVDDFCYPGTHDDRCWQ